MFCPNCGHGLTTTGDTYVDETRGSASGRVVCPDCGLGWQVACQVQGGQVSMTLLAETFPLARLRGLRGAVARGLPLGLRRWLFDEEPRVTPLVIGGEDG